MNGTWQSSHLHLTNVHRWSPIQNSFDQACNLSPYPTVNPICKSLEPGQKWCTPERCQLPTEPFYDLLTLPLSFPSLHFPYQSNHPLAGAFIALISSSALFNQNYATGPLISGKLSVPLGSVFLWTVVSTPCWCTLDTQDFIKLRTTNRDKPNTTTNLKHCLEYPMTWNCRSELPAETLARLCQLRSEQPTSMALKPHQWQFRTQSPKSLPFPGWVSEGTQALQWNNWYNWLM